METWPGNTAVLDAADIGYLVHTNHALAPDVPRLFELTAESGGGSYGFTHQRLSFANETLSSGIDSINVDGFKKLFATRPVLVYPGKPTGRTISSMIVEIPASGSPTLYLTPDSPSNYDHARFTFD